MRQEPASLIIGFFLAAGGWLSAAAQPANYGDFVGDTVVYEDVSEDGDATFSTPIISGDELTFSPGGIDFEAVSTAGGQQSVTGRINTVLVGRFGRGVTDVQIEGSGLLSLLGIGGTATSATNVTAAVTLTATVIEADGSAIGGGPVALSSQMATLVSVDYAGSDAFNSPWGGTASFDLSSLADTEAGIQGLLTRVGLTIEATLTATSETGTQSRINLGNFDALTLTVPEPGTVVLLISAGSLLVMRRRTSI